MTRKEKWDIVRNEVNKTIDNFSSVFPNTKDPTLLSIIRPTKDVANLMDKLDGRPIRFPG